MEPPDIQPGLVVHFDYLWRHQFEAGSENAPYPRPCAVILAIATDERGRRMVVAPITHREPADLEDAVEVPPRVKAHLGLDHERSWIITDDLNLCGLPSPDLLPVPAGPKAGAMAYGMLPPALFEIVRNKITAHPPVPTPRTA